MKKLTEIRVDVKAFFGESTVSVTFSDERMRQALENRDAMIALIIESMKHSYLCAMFDVVNHVDVLLDKKGDL